MPTQITQEFHFFCFKEKHHTLAKSAACKTPTCCMLCYLISAWYSDAAWRTVCNMFRVSDCASGNFTAGAGPEAVTDIGNVSILCQFPGGREACFTPRVIQSATPGVIPGAIPEAIADIEDTSILYHFPDGREASRGYIRGYYQRLQQGLQQGSYQG